MSLKIITKPIFMDVMAIGLSHALQIGYITIEWIHPWTLNQVSESV